MTHQHTQILSKLRHALLLAMMMMMENNEEIGSQIWFCFVDKFK